MSMTLGIYRGKAFDPYKSEFVDMIPVSFQRVWGKVWEKAIADCGVRIFRDCMDFTIQQIPEVLSELSRVLDWVRINGGGDTVYVTERIRDELTPFLTDFYAAHKDEEYWFSLG